MIIIFSNKSTVILILSIIILVGVAMIRNLSKDSDKTQKIIITNSVVSETTTSENIATNTTTVAKVSKNTTLKTTIKKITETKTEAVAVEEFLYININEADFDELLKLNGIGERIAENIIEYRNQNGGFSNIDELVNVSGIGEKTLEKIRENVYVDNPVYETEPIFETEPEIIEEFEEPTEETTAHEEILCVNINEAGVDELVALPYVDEEIAEKIIEIRNNIGGFSNVYELLYIDGLSKEKVSEIIKYVYIDTKN